jgi:hypothetical protein
MRRQGNSETSIPPPGRGLATFRQWLTLLFAVGLLPTAGEAQGITSAWNYDSEPFGAGRQVFAVSTLNVGSDGSLAFTLTVDDGSLGNIEYRLFWLSPTGDLRWASEFGTASLQALAIRTGHLVYLEDGQQLHSVKRNPAGDFEDSTVATFASADTAYTIEQGRSPGFLFVAETAVDKASFKIHAFRLESGTTVDYAAMFAGVSGGAFTLFFPSATGELYQVERSEDMINWTLVGDPIPGTDSLQSYTDEGLSSTFYFRVRRL